MHPLARWIEQNGMTVEELAARAGCSQWHVRNIIAGRKGASLRLAKRLSDATGLGMDSFLREQERAA